MSIQPTRQEPTTVPMNTDMPVEAPTAPTTTEEPDFDQLAGGTLTLQGSTGTINAPGLSRPITFDTGMSVPEAVVIDLSIMYMTMQTIMNTTVTQIENKNNERKATFEDYFAKLNEKSEKSEEKCGGANVWMKVFQAVTIIASVAMLVGSLGTLGPVAVVMCAVALAVEATDMIVEAATGEGIIARAAVFMARDGGLLSIIGVPPEYRELVATIILTVALMVMSVGPGMVNGIRNIASGVFRSLDDTARAGAQSGKHAGNLAKGASTADDFGGAANASTKAQRAGQISSKVDDLMTEGNFYMKALADPINFNGWKKQLTAALEATGDFNPQQAKKFANSFHREAAGESRNLSKADKAAAVASATLKSGDAVASTTRYGVQGISHRMKLVLNRLQEIAAQLAELLAQVGKGKGGLAGAKAVTKAGKPTTEVLDPIAVAAKTGDAPLDAAGAASKVGGKPTAEVLDPITVAAKRGNSKAFSMLQDLATNYGLSVQSISKWAAYIQAVATMSQGAVSIHMGLKSIELGKLEKEIKLLETDLEVIDTYIEYLTGLFGEQAEMQGNIAQTMNDLAANKSKNLMKIIDG